MNVFFALDGSNLFILISFQKKMISFKSSDEALPGVLGNREKRAFIAREQRQNFEENRRRKTIFGNREYKKTNFQFLGNRGTSQFILGEQGNRYPHPLGGPQ